MNVRVRYTDTHTQAEHKAHYPVENDNQQKQIFTKYIYRYTV